MADLGSYHVKVHSSQGVVTLRGQVAYADFREAAEQLARRIGARQVINELTVAPEALARPTPDPEAAGGVTASAGAPEVATRVPLEERVRTALEDDPRVDAYVLVVSVEDRIAYLTGRQGPSRPARQPRRSPRTFPEYSAFPMTSRSCPAFDAGCSLDTYSLDLRLQNSEQLAEMTRNNSVATLAFILVLGIGAGLAFVTYTASSNHVWSISIGVGAFVIAYIGAAAIKVADQWDRAVVLRLGHFRALQGPGLFLIFPIIDTIPYWIDTRVITTSFTAEKTLTKDTVPVDVDAVLFWKVSGPQEGRSGCRRLSERHRLGVADGAA